MFGRAVYYLLVVLLALTPLGFACAGAFVVNDLISPERHPRWAALASLVVAGVLFFFFTQWTKHSPIFKRLSDWMEYMRGNR